MKLPILIATVLVLATSPSFAAQDAHDHGHAQHSAKLQLNAGKKWETDAPLRKAMGEIRQSMASSLHVIHDNKLSPQAYGGLAKGVEAAVGDMVANCKLGPQADAQLHIIIADLLVGAEQMAGKTQQGKNMDGAVKGVGALNNYGKYFNDPGFWPITH